MTSVREKTAAILLVALVIAASMAGLWPELTISRVDLNDNVFHFTLIEGMIQSVEQGCNPLDFWSPEWSFGYPVLRTYQPLAHALVVLVYFGLGKAVSAMTVFVWVRFLSVALLPLTFFAAARLLSLGPLEAAAAGLLAPLVSTNFLYGVEYGSYMWSGSGLFTQAVATHFLLLTIGFAFAGIQTGRRLGLAGIFLGLTFLSHFIYGYIGALTVCLLAVLPDQKVPRGVKIQRTLRLGAMAFLVAAFELIPMLRDAAFINHSRWEAAWKWDSFGAAPVLKLLFTGELLDHGRLPVLSLLALLGIGMCFWIYRQDRRVSPVNAFVLAGAALWLLMFFGRPFWGPLLTLLGAASDLQLHRLIGGLHIFLVLLAAIGLAFLWRVLARRWHWAVAALATAALLYPMVTERARLLSNNSVWGHNNLAAYESNRQALETTIATVRDRGGRVYPGLAATWGGKFKIGDVPFYAFLSEAQVPAVAFLYHAMALPADIMVRFNEQAPAQYRLFNIRTVVAPAQGVTVPAFLVPREQIGPFRIFEAPGGNYFDVVDALFAVRTTRNNFFDVNDRWLQSDWVAKKQHLQLDLGDNLAQLPRVDPEAPLFPPPALPSPGSVVSEHQNGASYDAEVDAARPSFALFRMTWHRNWKAYVDGRPERTVMLSPGFVGVPLTPGRHKIRARYEAGGSKAILALSGFLLALVVSALPPPPVRLRFDISRWMGPGLVRRLGRAAGIVALALPVSISVMTSRLPDGHDALEYFPRMEEFHENITEGNLFPRWAPDLSRGTGQPFFEFNPPVIYYTAEIWHLSGFDFLTSVNLAAAVLVLASALSMFLLGRLYFGVWGGWLAAAAYLYAPYFSLDLYVRSALAEFAAFPFFPLALYGFGGFARTGKRAYLLTGAVAYAGVMWSHNAAALLFTPLLIGFIAFTSWIARSWSTLRGQAFGFLLGLGFGACVWVPSLIDRQYVGLSRLLEGALRYTNHFVYLHQLFDSPWGYGLSVPGDKDGMSFALGWSHLLIAAGTWILIVRMRRHADRAWMIFFTAAAAVLSALMLENAMWLWDRVPLLQYVEFPWRLLGPVSVCLALLVAPLGPVLASLRRWGKVGFAGAIALLIVPNASHNQSKGFRDLDLSSWTPQQIATRGIEVTTAAEYVPRWVKVWPAYDPRPVRILNGDAVVQEVSRTPTSWSVHIQTKSGGTAEMPIAWFPGWQVRVDRKIVETQPADPTGLIRFQVPAGDHVLQAAWTRTPARWLGDGLTLLSLVALAILVVRSRPPKTTPSGDWPASLESRSARDSRRVSLGFAPKNH